MNFLGKDGSPAATEYFNVPAAVVVEQVFHVFEKFNMPPPVGSDGNTMNIFLNGTFYYFPYTSVMAQMNDLRTFALQDAPHDIDGGVMSIEQGGSGNDSYFGSIRHRKLSAKGKIITKLMTVRFIVGNCTTVPFRINITSFTTSACHLKCAYLLTRN